MERQLSRLLQTLLARGRTIQRHASHFSGLLRSGSGRAEFQRLDSLCRQLLSGQGEVSGLTMAQEIIDGYNLLQAEAKRKFFTLLAEVYAPDWQEATAAWATNEAERSRTSFQTLIRALEPPRQELFRRINRTTGGTQALLKMRTDLLDLMRELPELASVDDDLLHLLRSWFNRGFLVMERIGWSTPADLLERLIRYEAVHQIGNWDELRRRLLPPDRRCYAFFHPALANDPLIFVEVALTREMPDSIQLLLAADREPQAAEAATTAVFYSISNCQAGLQGISFGNLLIKQVVGELLRELPNLATFVTLSPAPGLHRWLTGRPSLEAGLSALLEEGSVPPEEGARAAVAAELMPLAAEYLLDAKDASGRPLDPVARFHLGNGAQLDRICWPADVSAKGVATSAGVMVNYHYDLKRLEDNHEAYANERRIIASNTVRRLRKSRPASRAEIPSPA